MTLCWLVETTCCLPMWRDQGPLHMSYAIDSPCDSIFSTVLNSSPPRLVLASPQGVLSAHKENNVIPSNIIQIPHNNAWMTMIEHRHLANTKQCFQRQTAIKAFHIGISWRNCSKQVMIIISQGQKTKKDCALCFFVAVWTTLNRQWIRSNVSCPNCAWWLLASVCISWIEQTMKCSNQPCNIIKNDTMNLHVPLQIKNKLFHCVSIFFPCSCPCVT